MLSFEYDFEHINDTVSFAYSLPYTYSKVFKLVRTTMASQLEILPHPNNQYVKESSLCKSISGLEVPMLTVTTRVNRPNYEEIIPDEFSSPDLVPLNKYKK
jgi:hypothetical protein